MAWHQALLLWLTMFFIASPGEAMWEWDDVG